MPPATSQNGLHREKKLQDRKYVTVVLSDGQIPEGLPFRCYGCGRIVATTHNETKAIIQAKVPLEDVKEGNKLVGNLCKDCNIMFLFV